MSNVEQQIKELKAQQQAIQRMIDSKLNERKDARTKQLEAFMVERFGRVLVPGDVLVWNKNLRGRPSRYRVGERAFECGWPGVRLEEVEHTQPIKTGIPGKYGYVYCKGYLSKMHLASAEELAGKTFEHEVVIEKRSNGGNKVVKRFRAASVQSARRRALAAVKEMGYKRFTGYSLTWCGCELIVDADHTGDTLGNGYRGSINIKTVLKDR